MNILQTNILRGAVLALLCAVAMPVYAQSYPWENDLRDQLQESLQCELNYMTNVRSFELIGKLSISARVHCKDGRAFDAERRAGSDKFEFASCDTVTC